MKFIGKILLTACAYVIGVILSGLIGPMLHFPMLQPPAGIDPKKAFLMTIIATPLLVLGMVPLATGLRANWAKRTLAFGSLLFVTLGLNTVLELLIFSTMFKGGSAWMSVHWVLPCAMAGGTLAFCFGSGEGRSSLRPRTLLQWPWRVLLAWLSFPVIYFIFGMCVGPFVVEQYRSGVSWLTLPPMTVIVRMQLLRSALFLAASMPAVVLWKRSRTQFIVAMGLAHAMAVGIFQLAQATFLPTVLRVAHSLEITADSFVYALVLGLLFVGNKATQQNADQARAASVS